MSVRLGMLETQHKRWLRLLRQLYAVSRALQAASLKRPRFAGCSTLVSVKFAPVELHHYVVLPSVYHVARAWSAAEDTGAL